MEYSVEKLIEKINFEKEKAIENGIIRKEKPQKEISDREKYCKLPDNWRWIRLGDYCLKATDYVASGSFASIKENVNYYNTENYAIMVKTADFANNFTKNLTYTDESSYKFLSNSNLFGGELILSNIGSIGKVFKVPYLNKPMTLASNTIMIKFTDDKLADYMYYYFKSNYGQNAIKSISSKVPYLNKPMTLASNTIMIKFTDDKLADYMYYYFKSNYGQNAIKSISSGTSMLKFNKTQLKTLPIPIPSIEIQEKIVTALDKAQYLIDKKKEQIDLLDELVKSRFVEMFGDPNCNNKNWKIKKFKDVSSNKDSDRVPIKQADREKRSGKYPYYGATGIIDSIDGYIFDGLYLLIAEDGKNLETKNKDIAFLAEGKFWVNNHAHVIKETNESNLYYLKYTINNMNLKPYITGIDQLKLNRGNLDNIELPIPPIQLQNEFAEFVTKIDEIKSKMEASLSELEDNFNSLMQKAFKGELF